MELCAYIDVVATLPQREYTCCHTQAHTNTLLTHPHTYALWAVAAKHARQFISLLQGAFATLFLYFHLIRSFHSICPTDWLGFVQPSESEGKGDGYTLELCPRRTRATCERVEYSASTVFASHARTHTECDKYEGGQQVLTAKESLDC